MGEPMAVALWAAGAIVGGLLLALVVAWVGKHTKKNMPRINGGQR